MAANAALSPKPAIPFQFYRKQAGAKGVQSNGIATADIPAVGRHYAYVFEFKTAAGAALTQAQIKSEVSEIRVKINGEVIVEASPAFLFARHNYYYTNLGAPVNDGVLILPWHAPQLDTAAQRAFYPLGTEDVRDITVEFVTGTLTNLAVIDVYVSSTNERTILGPHLRIKKHPQTFNTTGEQVISDLPFGPDQALLAYHIGLGTTPGVLKEVSLIGDNVQLLDRVTLPVQTAMLELGGRTLQADYFPIDYGVNNEFMGYFRFVRNGRLIQDWRQILNWSTSPGGLYNIYSEHIHNLPANM